MTEPTPSSLGWGDPAVSTRRYVDDVLSGGNFEIARRVLLVALDAAVDNGADEVEIAVLREGVGRTVFELSPDLVGTIIDSSLFEFLRQPVTDLHDDSLGMLIRGQALRAIGSHHFAQTELRSLATAKVDVSDPRYEKAHELHADSVAQLKELHDDWRGYSQEIDAVAQSGMSNEFAGRVVVISRQIGKIVIDLTRPDAGMFDKGTRIDGFEPSNRLAAELAGALLEHAHLTKEVREALEIDSRTVGLGLAYAMDEVVATLGDRPRHRVKLSGDRLDQWVEASVKASGSGQPLPPLSLHELAIRSPGMGPEPC